MAQEKATLDNYLHLASTLGVPAELEELHRDIMVPASEHGWAVYYKDKDVAEVVDLYLGKYQEYLDGLAPSPPTPPAATAPKPRKAARPKASPSQPVVITQTYKPLPKEVEEISTATRLIKRFCGVVNREVELADLVRLLKALQQAILKKLVRATSGFAPELRDIQQTLVEIANTATPGQVRLDVPDDKLAVYLSIAGGEAVYESVRLLSRYIRQQGLSPKPEWAKRWIKSASRFLASTTGQTDPLHNHILGAIESLEGYLKSGRMEASKLDLRGLGGLLGLGNVDGMGCTPGNPCKTPCRAKAGAKAKAVSGLGELEAELALMKSGRVPDQRPAYHYVPQGEQVQGLGSLERIEQLAKPRRKGQPLMTGSDLMAVSYSTYEFSEPIATLTGKVAKGFLAMLHGLPGQGKSTFGLQWAVDAARLGPVLYVSSEEHGSYTLKDKVSRAGGPVAGMDFAASLSDADLSRYRFLFIDSVNHAGMEIDQLRRLREKYPQLSVVLVMQSTKEGQFKGSQEWAHETDLVIAVEGGRARTQKNRYAPLSSIQVF